MQVLMSEALLSACMQLPVRGQHSVQTSHDTQAHMRLAHGSPTMHVPAQPLPGARLQTEPSMSTAKLVTLSAVPRARSDVDYIIHCAASIRFDLPVKAVLRANFLPTRALLDLAAALPGLRAFTFMSTAFANAHLPQARARQHFF